MLKTLGFGDNQVAWYVLGESVLICILGGILGVGLAALTAPLANTFAQQFAPGAFAMSWQIGAGGVGVAALLGVVVGAVPAWSARRLSIADALRRG